MEVKIIEKTQKSDRLGINPFIAEKESAVVKPLTEVSRHAVSTVERLKESLAAKKAALFKKFAPEPEILVIPVEDYDEPIDTAGIEAQIKETVVAPVETVTAVPPQSQSGVYTPSYNRNAPYSQGTMTRNPQYQSSTPTSTRQTTAAPDLSRPKPTAADNDFRKKPALPVADSKKKPADDKRNLSKKAKISKGYEQVSASVEYDESGDIMKVRPRRTSNKKKAFAPPPVQMAIDHAVITSELVSIKILSEKIGKTGAEIIKKLFLELKILKSITDVIDFDMAELIAAEFGVTLELKLEQTSEEKLFAFHSDDDTADNNADLVQRPPIVTIMGHVDHGKTSILDYIRKESVAQGEAGGITQHIGAYTISVPSEYGVKSITFLDTPGHEAFTAMRARGANVTDIVIIVVAADDGIMPQTIEAINHAKAANAPMIVAINKMDKPTADAERILSQLSDHNVLVEEWSGTVPAVRVSAKTGLGIPSLLENILLLAEVSSFKANPERSAKGTIVEAKLDKGKGPVATVLVQNGTLRTGDFIVAGTAVGRIRAMFDDKGKQVNEALPSTPVSILGLQDVPNAGDQIMVVTDEKLSKQVVEERKNKEKISKLQNRKITLEDVFSRIEEGKFKNLNLIIKADVQGSIEALKGSLLRLSNDEVKIHCVHAGVGAINDSDISLADTTDAIIIGFNVRPDSNAKNSAEKIGVEVKTYRVIYDAVEDIKLAVKGMLAPTFKEVYLGRAEVRAVYKTPVGLIAGCMVKDGKITRNAKSRLLRDGIVISDTEISSLKRFKDDVKEVNSGFECGIGLAKFDDIRENDVIEAYIMEEIAR